MRTGVRWRVALILTVLVISSSIGVFPVVATCYGVTRPRFLLDKALKLGLDLKGGVYLVVRVQTDEGLRIQTEAESERLREQLAKARVTFRNLTISSPIQIRIDRITPEQDGVFRQAATEAETTFERTAEPNGTYLFTLRPNVQAALREESVVQALQTIERR